MSSEVLSQKRLEGGVSHTYTTSTTNNYYGLGGALSSSTASTASTPNVWYSGSQTTNNSTSYSYAIWEDARVSSTTHDSNTSSGSNPLFISTFIMTAPADLASVNIADGQAIKRDESDNNYNASTGGDPHQGSRPGTQAGAAPASAAWAAVFSKALNPAPESRNSPSGKGT